jgi:YbbR domain-containing protein
MPRRASDLWLLVLAGITASFLWLLAHRSSTDQKGYDIPVLLQGVPDNLVVTDQSADVINIQVRSTAANQREISSARIEYPVDVSGAKPGPALYEVDQGLILSQLPRGSQITSRSPASIEVTYERRGRKSVRIRPDLEGEPAQGFVLQQVSVEPPRVWLEGARSSVLRLSEVVTETIDVSGLQESQERDARLNLGAGNVWMEEARPVKVRILIEPEEPLEGDGDEPGSGGTG